MFRLTLLTMFFLGSTYAGVIDFSNCAPGYRVTEVELEGCDVIPCDLQIGNTYRINITIKSTYPSDAFTQEMYVAFDAVDVRIDILPHNPCASLPCPVVVNTGFKFSGTVVVENNLVPEKGTLYWTMTTNTGKIAVCMKTVVRVVEKQARRIK